MSWVAILRALLSLSSSVAAYVQEKQLLEAGEAKAIAEGLRNAQIAINKARKARDAANTDFDKRDGVPDESDPNLRD